VTIERLPVSISIALYALVLTLLVGILSGVLAALRQNSWVDQAVMTFALIGVSVPNFWLGLMLIVLFAVHLGWLPSGGYVDFRDDLFGWLQATTLPAISLAMLQMGLLARITRSTMLEVLRQDYIRTARAKGLPEHRVLGDPAPRLSGDPGRPAAGRHHAAPAQSPGRRALRLFRSQGPLPRWPMRRCAPGPRRGSSPRRRSLDHHGRARAGAARCCAGCSVTSCS
jgi:hypothetical protein